MPSILGIIQDICVKVGVAKPSAVFGSTEDEHQELAALANEVGERIATEYDWHRMKRLQTYTGDGTSTAFALPTDYHRMPEPQNVYSSSWTIGPLRHVTSHDQWLYESVQGWNASPTSWTLLEGQMQFMTAPASGEVLKWYFMSNLFVRSSGTTVSDFFPLDLPFEFADSDTYGSRKPQFDDDGDYYQLDSRLLKLGMIWQWKADKGLPYAEDMETFDRLLESRQAKDGGPGVIVAGGSRRDDDYEIAYPRVLRAS